jgi:hypothetical protein
MLRKISVLPRHTAAVLRKKMRERAVLPPSGKILHEKSLRGDKQTRKKCA